MEMVINKPPLSRGVMTHKLPYERTDGIKVIGKSKAAGTSFEPRSLTLSQIKLRDRLFSRWSEILEESKNARRFFPDPTQALVELLSGTPGDYAIWREIIEEPYG